MKCDEIEIQEDYQANPSYISPRYQRINTTPRFPMTAICFKRDSSVDRAAVSYISYHKHSMYTEQSNTNDETKMLPHLAHLSNTFIFNVYHLLLFVFFGKKLLAHGKPCGNDVHRQQLGPHYSNTRDMRERDSLTEPYVELVSIGYNTFKKVE